MKPRMYLLLLLESILFKDFVYGSAKHIPLSMISFNCTFTNCPIERSLQHTFTFQLNLLYNTLFDSELLRF